MHVCAYTVCTAPQKRLISLHLASRLLKEMRTRHSTSTALHLPQKFPRKQYFPNLCIYKHANLSVKSLLSLHQSHYKENKIKWAACASVAVSHNLLRKDLKKPTATTTKNTTTSHPSKNRWAARVATTLTLTAQIFHLPSMSLTLISHEQTFESVYL